MVPLQPELKTGWKAPPEAWWLAAGLATPSVWLHLRMLSSAGCLAHSPAQVQPENEQGKLLTALENAEPWYALVQQEK